VIDVLRAATSLPHALAAGASAVVPLATVEEARRRAASHAPETVLLCGEREGRPLPGFDLGNSPAEYTPERVAGRTLLYCSTNGSGAVARWGGRVRELMTLSFVNVSAAVERLAGAEGSVLLVCAGQEGRACLEDTVLAGLAAHLLRERRPDLLPDDGTRLAEAAWESWGGDVEAMLRASSHGRYLESLGFGGDLVLCARRDTVPVIPVWVGDRLVAARMV